LFKVPFIPIYPFCGFIFFLQAQILNLIDKTSENELGETNYGNNGLSSQILAKDYYIDSKAFLTEIDSKPKEIPDKKVFTSLSNGGEIRFFYSQIHSMVNVHNLLPFQLTYSYRI
jgi:hypothetical protein